MDLIGAEIFATGKWNGLEFEDGDLEEIVTNFEALSDNQKVPLKLGHNDEQPVTDGQPALGWVSRVYKKGSKLLADFTDMPKAVYEAIKKRLYRTVSVELLMNTEHKGQKYNYVLDAVALLGADQPAVNTLSDLNLLTASRAAEFSGGRVVSFQAIAGKGPKHGKSGGSAMDAKEISAAIKEAVTEAVEPIKQKLADTEAELKAEREKRESLEAERKEDAERAEKAKVENARKAVNETLDELVKSGSMTPAFRESYAKQVKVDDDAEVLKLDPSEIKEMFMRDDDAGRQQFGRQGTRDEGEDGENAEDKLILMTRKNMADTGEKDFAVAFERIAAANPKLHVEYLNSNGVKEG